MTAADIKAVMASIATTGPVIVFQSGSGDGHLMCPVAVEGATGERVMFLVAVPPAGASAELLAAYSARATANIRGRCPLCDAVTTHPGAVDEHGEAHSTTRHADNCPVCDDNLLALVDAHLATGRNDRCPCGSGRKFKHCHGSP